VDGAHGEIRAPCHTYALGLWPGRAPAGAGEAAPPLRLPLSTVATCVVLDACAICLDAPPSLPVALACGHVVCASCLWRHALLDHGWDAVARRHAARASAGTPTEYHDVFSDVVRCPVCACVCALADAAFVVEVRPAATAVTVAGAPWPPTRTLPLWTCPPRLALTGPLACHGSSLLPVATLTGLPMPPATVTGTPLPASAPCPVASWAVIADDGGADAGGGRDASAVASASQSARNAHAAADELAAGDSTVDGSTAATAARGGPGSAASGGGVAASDDGAGGWCLFVAVPASQWARKSADAVLPPALAHTCLDTACGAAAAAARDVHAELDAVVAAKHAIMDAARAERGPASAAPGGAWSRTSVSRLMRQLSASGAGATGGDGEGEGHSAGGEGAEYFPLSWYTPAQLAAAERCDEQRASVEKRLVAARAVQAALECVRAALPPLVSHPTPPSAATAWLGEEPALYVSPGPAGLVAHPASVAAHLPHSSSGHPVAPAILARVVQVDALPRGLSGFTPTGSLCLSAELQEPSSLVCLLPLATPLPPSVQWSGVPGLPPGVSLAVPAPAPHGGGAVPVTAVLGSITALPRDSCSPALATATAARRAGRQAAQARAAFTAALAITASKPQAVAGPPRSPPLRTQADLLRDVMGITDHRAEAVSHLLLGAPAGRSGDTAAALAAALAAPAVGMPLAAATPLDVAFPALESAATKATRSPLLGSTATPTAPPPLPPSSGAVTSQWSFRKVVSTGGVFPTLAETMTATTAAAPPPAVTGGGAAGKRVGVVPSPPLRGKAAPTVATASPGVAGVGGGRAGAGGPPRAADASPVALPPAATTAAAGAAGGGGHAGGTSLAMWAQRPAAPGPTKAKGGKRV
jgi:hypothetical protein